MNSENIEIKREWWVEKWLELLDKYRFKKRLERGRNYAREGNVKSIEFAKAKVLANVQGTQPEPYQVSLHLNAFTDEEWGYVIETMAEKAIFAAKMLAGEMPPDIETVFLKNGLSLFPYKLDEIRGQCSCPDKANPCKHIAAIYYLLGDRFSEDPFILFQLRGRNKEQILTQLRQIRSNTEVENHPETKLENYLSSPSQPSVKIEKLWEYQENLESSLVVITSSPSGGTVLDLLGPIPLASDGEAGIKSTSVSAVMQYLQNIYQSTSQQAMLSAMTSDN